MKTIKQLIVAASVMLGVWPTSVVAATPAAGDEATVVTNPLIWADVPDIDMVCVGDDYYMVSTTMHLSPGAPIMHSKDLKHWRVASYVFDELHDSPANDLEGGNVYGRGQWAASLKYHNGLFYVFFGTGVHSYLYTAKDAAGPWTLHAKLPEYYHDAALFFDDDGRAYLFYNGGTVHVREFNADLTGFKSDGVDQDVVTLGDGALLEGTHAYKVNGMYYLTQIWWPHGGERTELCWRAKDIKGPYEHKVVLSDNMGYRGHGIAQGGFLQAHNGQWYGFLFQDHEAVGRVPFLVPCRWVDGWPMMGDENGRVPKTFALPGIKEQGTTGIVTSDDFDGPRLATDWQWNHNPDNALWSLNARKGWLRLTTGKVVGSIFEARNTISQRTEGPRCSAVVRMDVSKMKPGDHAGLSAYCADPGTIEVVCGDKGRQLVMTDRGVGKDSVRLKSKVVYLKMDCDFTSDNATFQYSTDGRNFAPLGSAFHMVYNLKHFMGNRMAIFNYATRNAGGHVDVDYFHYTGPQE